MRSMALLVASLVTLLVATRPLSAKPAASTRSARSSPKLKVVKAKPAKKPSHPCLAALAKARINARPAAARKGIEAPVEVTGTLGGVEYFSMSSKKKPLVVDCSLVYSLVQAGPMLREVGITRARYSGSYQIRNVRGTNKPSKHSYGLALDVHSFNTHEGESLSVLDDYEMGLGDEVDCVGDPGTEAARALRTIVCQFERGAVFRKVLTPDYDADHANHYHLEASAWSERMHLRPLVAPKPAVASKGKKRR